MRWFHLFALPVVVATAPAPGVQPVAATGVRRLSNDEELDHALAQLSQKLKGEAKDSREAHAIGALVKNLANLKVEKKLDKPIPKEDNRDVKLEKQLLLKMLKEHREAALAKQKYQRAYDAIAGLKTAKNAAQTNWDEEQQQLLVSLKVLSKTRARVENLATDINKLVTKQKLNNAHLDKEKRESGQARAALLDEVASRFKRRLGEHQSDAKQIENQIAEGGIAAIVDPDTAAAIVDLDTKKDNTETAAAASKELTTIKEVSNVATAEANQVGEALDEVEKAKEVVADAVKTITATENAIQLASQKATTDAGVDAAKPQWAQDLSSLTTTIACCTFVGLAASLLALAMHFKGSMCKKNTRQMVDTSSDEEYLNKA